MMTTRRLKIYQIAEGYCYNSDSLFLWDFILPHIKSNARVLEVGSGSGVIGLLCAKFKRISLYQLEKQVVYAIMNAKNAQINNIDSIIINADCNMLASSKDLLKDLHENMLCNSNLKAIETSQALYECNLHKQRSIDSIMSSLESKTTSIHARHTVETSCNLSQANLDSITFMRDYHNMSHTSQNNMSSQNKSLVSLPYFDIIISNPPFYHANTLQSQNTLKAQATQSRYLPFENILKLAKRVLKPNAKLIFCYAPTMLTEILKSLRTFNFSVELLRFVYPRIERDSTLVLIYARYNGKAQMRVLPPLITHNGLAQQDNTKEVLSIYKRAHTQSIKICYDDISWHHLLRSLCI